MSIAVPKIRGPLALASASLFLVLSPGVACATPPRPRPVELDPSNPAAIESPTLPVMASLTPRTGPPLAPDDETSLEDLGVVHKDVIGMRVIAR